MDTTHKAMMIDLFSSLRIRSFATVSALIVFHFTILRLELVPTVVALYASLLGLTLHYIFVTTKSLQKLKDHRSPEEFRRLYVITRVIQTAGVAISIALLNL